MATGDYYTALGVARGASAKEIQAAYRRLARKYHPDVTGGDKAAEERFKAINEAYEVLSDGKKRAAYDKWGDRWMQAEQLEQMQRAGGFGAGPGSGLRFDFGGEGAAFDGGVFEDLGGGGFGQIFDRFFRGAPVRGQAARAKGADIRQGVTVTLAEAYEGTTRTVQLQSQEACSTCGGEGQIGNATGHACQGTGRRAAGKRLEGRIPA
ncbi:MAG: DnaJ domain-containing protein, partial [Dehalococcoidia bacterium]